MGSRRAWRNALIYLVLIVGALFFLLPFAWMVSTSLKPDHQVFSIPPEWIPVPVMWSNYARLMTEIPFLRYLGNTVFVTVLSVTFYVASSAVVAYGFAKIRFPGRDLLFYCLLATMVLPPQVTLIPQFVMFQKLGWVGTFLPLIVPALTGSAFAVFLLRQFYTAIPGNISDSARIDGANEWQIFTRIVLPLSRPALATASLFIFIWTWTDFLNPLIYLTDDRLYTLAIGLQQLSSTRAAAWPLLMAGSLLMSLPIVVLFFFAQKTFIEGVSTGAVKG
ncbi:MAG: carbohydrate ABC transporter permease [Trueperaceae bacterium]|jgi:multiple sugar transport system permease protein